MRGSARARLLHERADLRDRRIETPFRLSVAQELYPFYQHPLGVGCRVSSAIASSAKASSGMYPAASRWSGVRSVRTAGGASSITCRRGLLIGDTLQSEESTGKIYTCLLESEDTRPSSQALA